MYLKDLLTFLGSLLLSTVVHRLFEFHVEGGSGSNRGHYIAIVKSHGFWLLYDDDIVEG